MKDKWLQETYKEFLRKEEVVELISLQYELNALRNLISKALEKRLS